MTAAALPEAAPSLRARPGRPRAGVLDALVGKRARERRLALGLTQQRLAEMVGITYQQLHKYETGANRLPAGRLFLLAEALGVGVAHFFGEDGEGEVTAPTGHRRALLELVRDFARIPDRKQQEAVARLACTLADLGGDGGTGTTRPRPSHSAIATAPGRSRPPVAVSGPGAGGRPAGPESSAGSLPDLIRTSPDLLPPGPIT